MDELVFSLIKGVFFGVGKKAGESLFIDTTDSKEKTTQTTAIVKEWFRKMFK